MKKQHDNFIEELIFRYLRGECSDEEAKCLEEWKGRSSRNRQIFAKIEELVSYREFLLDADSYDVAKAFAKIRRKIAMPERNRKWSRYVAAIVIPVLMALGIYSLVERPGGDNTDAEILPGGSKAFLYLSDGRVVDLHGESCAEITDGSFNEIRNEDGALLNYSEADRSTSMQELVYHKISIPRGGEYSVILDDGTKVWLNSETVLEFPVAFVGDRREVKLQGEAFFEVAKDAGRPFHVMTAHGSIEVTGTSFNISAYPGEPKTTAVLETGSIVFHTIGNDYPMRPGQCAEHDISTQETVVTEVDTRLYTAWHLGTLYFDDTTLSEIMDRLSRWYNVDVRFADESLGNLRFSGAVEKKKPLSHILNLLENTQDVKFTTTGGKLVIVDKK